MHDMCLEYRNEDITWIVGGRSERQWFVQDKFDRITAACIFLIAPLKYILQGKLQVPK